MRNSLERPPVEGEKRDEYRDERKRERERERERETERKSLRCNGEDEKRREIP